MAHSPAEARRAPRGWGRSSSRGPRGRRRATTTTCVPGAVSIAAAVSPLTTAAPCELVAKLLPAEACGAPRSDQAASATTAAAAATTTATTSGSDCGGRRGAETAANTAAAFPHRLRVASAVGSARHRVEAGRDTRELTREEPGRNLRELTRTRSKTLITR